MYVAFRVATKKDLIWLKKPSGSKQDQADIEKLKDDKENERPRSRTLVGCSGQKKGVDGPAVNPLVFPLSRLSTGP